MNNQRTHVVIVGGGFAGLNCALKLASCPKVRVTLIDKNNYQQFQPLLYQVASGLLAPSNAAFPLRGEHCHELTGPIAFAAWLGVHAALLTTTNAKVGTVMDWAWNYSARSVVSRFQITQEDMRSIGTRTKNKSRLRLTLRHSEPAQD